jgi:hypothetical protein
MLQTVRYFIAGSYILMFEIPYPNNGQVQVHDRESLLHKSNNAIGLLTGKQGDVDFG